jgi:glycosyltransferase involved in cell wall biosynthesis
VASRSEAGFSASIFEAQRAGVPLIHSDIGPFVERLGMDDRFAVRFRVGDAEDLARAMRSVAGDPVAARARAVAARERFCSRTWEDVAREYLEVFAEACAEGPSTRDWSPAAQSVQRPPLPDAGPRRRLRDRVLRLFRRRR